MVAVSRSSPSIYVFRLADGEEVSVLNGFKLWITAMVWSPDGNFLAASSEEGNVVVWNALTVLEEQRWQLHL